MTSRGMNTSFIEWNQRYAFSYSTGESLMPMVDAVSSEVKYHPEFHSFGGLDGESLSNGHQVELGPIPSNYQLTNGPMRRLNSL